MAHLTESHPKEPMIKNTNKYGAKKTVVDGITFDSKAEASRYGALKLLQKAGHITALELQVPFILAPQVRFEGAARAKPALKYVADFVYVECDTNRKIVEDCKGVLTDAFQIKRHFMLSVHGISVRLSK
jgi:hypothetical protein